MKLCLAGRKMKILLIKSICFVDEGIPFRTLTIQLQVKNPELVHYFIVNQDMVLELKNKY